MRNMPKSDVRVVILVVLLLVSWFFHTIQYQKYEKAIKFLKFATLNNLNLKNGGTKQTMELFRRATELYDQEIAQSELTFSLFLLKPFFLLQYQSSTYFIYIYIYALMCIFIYFVEKASGDKSAGKIKMLKDPYFQTVVDKVSKTFKTNYFILATL